MTFYINFMCSILKDKARVLIVTWIQHFIRDPRARSPATMRRRFNIFEVFSDMKKSFSDIKISKFLISEKWFFDIIKSIFWFQELFFDIKKIEFLISKNYFLISENT